VQGALRRIQAYQAGENVQTPDATDCLDTLNDLLDSLSIDKEWTFGSNENVLAWTAGQTQYTVGNPICTLLGGVAFVGTVTSGSPTITGVTSIPTNLVAGASPAYQIGSGSILTDNLGYIPASTTVTAFNAGAQTVTMSANATASGVVSILYTVPGNFPIPRPLRITHGFTRFNNLDFTLDVYETQTQFTEILYKAQPGPWPTVAWYNNQFPYGLLNVYQAPGNNSTLHLFTDTILGNLTLNQVLVMPQGYSRALKLMLAREIWIEFIDASAVPTMLEKLAGEAREAIKALNAQPAAVGRYDSELSRGNRWDASWIFRGGY